MKSLLLLISFVGGSFVSTAQCSAGASAVLTGNPVSPSEVEFTSLCTGSTGSIITIDYGDGNFGTIIQGQSPNPWLYTYNAIGFYYYCITIYDSLNACTDMFCDSINISNVPAYCDASFSYTYGASAFDVIFNNSGNLSNVSVTESWDFGDGTNSTATNPSHTYSAVGNYVVCHTVTDIGGQCADTWCDTVLVDTTTAPPPPTPCNASFYWYQDSSTTQTVIVINNSTGGNGPASISYLWDFGDGTTSTQAYPSHVYSNLGMFYVCLTITDNSNPFLPCTSTSCDSVWVTFKAAGFTLNVYPPEVAAIESLSANSVELFPNPVSDELNILVNAEEYPLHYLVYDLNGKIILEGDQLNSEDVLDVFTLDQGVYLVHLAGYGIYRIVKE